MKVIDPGHVYDLDWLDGEPFRFLDSLAEPEQWHCQNRLTFVKREGEKYPRNVGHHPGTNMQEVLRALIDRVKYVDNQIPDDNNETTIGYLRLALFCLEERAARRHGRTLDVEIIPRIELKITCKKCGHIGCEGACHP